MSIDEKEWSGVQTQPVAFLAVGFVGPGLAGVRGWRVQPAHFAERHGLIVIIAIGEALVAIGFGARGTGLGGGVITATVLNRSFRSSALAFRILK